MARAIALYASAPHQHRADTRRLSRNANGDQTQGKQQARYAVSSERVGTNSVTRGPIMCKVLQTLIGVAVLSVGLSSGYTVFAQSPSGLPWMNTSLSPEQRADLLIPRMTLEQKVQQI